MQLCVYVAISLSLPIYVQYLCIYVSMYLCIYVCVCEFMCFYHFINIISLVKDLLVLVRLIQLQHCALAE
jgi:hypothetical protein